MHPKPATMYANYKQNSEGFWYKILWVTHKSDKLICRSAYKDKREVSASNICSPLLISAGGQQLQASLTPAELLAMELNYGWYKCQVLTRKMNVSYETDNISLLQFVPDTVRWPWVRAKSRKVKETSPPCLWRSAASLMWSTADCWRL